MQINKLIALEQGELDEREEIQAYQEMINDGSVWRMQGSAGRRAMDLLRAGLCELGSRRFTDYYGNIVPSRYDVKPGTTGAPLATRTGGAL